MPAQDKITLRQMIRKAGLRVTAARMATLELLHIAIAPLTHAEVAIHLQELGVDKATAFRNLTDFTKAGILRRTELGDRVFRFELVGKQEQNHDPHAHFLCLNCGTVSNLPEIEIAGINPGPVQQIWQVSEILLRGLCQECNQNSRLPKNTANIDQLENCPS